MSFRLLLLIFLLHLPTTTASKMQNTNTTDRALAMITPTLADPCSTGVVVLVLNGNKKKTECLFEIPDIKNASCRGHRG